ncbi:hypothetical protein FA95DRAFT_1561431 [Auriscalpium vulgare]|uniref:Uncharacterized protein n=1 Tax=Auriscalpium vulgare TaxID=40419 RepID=A0ACB8RMX5_9AGAM|nr:hypothetical protein FA95DRAFT_1561431 [Auriscalpium vulgare]
MPSTLPLELQHEIIRLIYRISQAHDIAYATLAACALVCKSWTQVAQSLIFRRAPALTTRGERLNPRSLSLFVRALRDDSRLGVYVRALTIDVNANFHALLEGPLSSAEHLPYEDGKAWAAVLNLCPRVEKLKFVGRRSGWDSREVRDRLGTVAVRPRALEFVTGISTAGVRTLLEMWSDVRWVTIHGLDILKIVPQPHWADMQLVGLELRPSDHRTVPNFNALESEDSSLRELVLLTQRWGEISPVLAARITSLTTIVPPPAHILERFTGLEELIILAAEEGFSPPNTVHHLGYHPLSGMHAARSNAHATNVAAAMSALPDLQLVTATRTSSEAVLDVLQGACRMRDVDFVVYPDGYSLPREKNLDWI